jgi:hypothetical protein
MLIHVNATVLYWLCYVNNVPVLSLTLCVQSDIVTFLLCDFVKTFAHISTHIIVQRHVMVVFGIHTDFVFFDPDNNA